MKKIFNIAIMLVMVLCMTGCGEKEFLTATDFDTKMKEKGYFTYSATENYEGVTTGYVAMSSDMMYQIEFYETADETAATSVYDKIYATATQGKTSSDTEVTEEKANYKKYTLTTSNSYIVISRIENTTIYVNAAIAQKDKVDAALTEIGY